MWVIKALTGPRAGHIYKLQTGKNLLGRSPRCDIKIDSQSVSKEHATLFVTDDSLILTDLSSRNGTYINGVRIQSKKLHSGDRFSIHDILFDVLTDTELKQQNQSTSHQKSVALPAWIENAALNIHYQQTPMSTPANLQAISTQSEHLDHAYPGAEAQAQGDDAIQVSKSGALSGIVNNIRTYIDNVAMPGVYLLAKTLPLRYAVAILISIYIAIATALTTMPVISMTKNSIRQESVRRARTIARQLAAVNRKALLEKNDLALSTQIADREEGVSSALIISAEEGTIIAPAAKRGEFANLPFVNQARREEKETYGFIDESNLGVAVPITYYNPATGNQIPSAFAIVLYDMGALAMDTSQTISLFIQNLALSLLAGAVLFFFLYKLIENPVDILNRQLDEALRDGRDDLQTDYQFSSLEKLVSNINSALSRIGQSSSVDAFAPVINREVEAANVVNMMAMPCLAISATDERIIAANSSFSHLVGGGVPLNGASLHDIPDPALQANLSDLIPKMRMSAGEIAISEIPFFGNTYEICGQAIMGSTEPVYFLITINQMVAGE